MDHSVSDNFWLLTEALGPQFVWILFVEATLVALDNTTGSSWININFLNELHVYVGVDEVKMSLILDSSIIELILFFYSDLAGLDSQERHNQ